MAPLKAPVVALLMWAGVQADDMADRQGFLSQTSAGDYDKFITPNLKHMKHTGGLDALSDRSNPAEHVPQEEKAAQKMLSNDSNMPVSLSGICIGLVSLATMLGLGLRGRIQRGLQSATILPGGDMSAPLAPGSFDNALELETQGSAINGTNILHGRSAMIAASSPGFVPYVFFINPLAAAPRAATVIFNGEGKYEGKEFGFPEKKDLWESWDPNAPRSETNFNPFERNSDGNAPDASGYFPGEGKYNDPQRPDVDFASMMAEKEEMAKIEANPKAGDVPGAPGRLA